MNEPSGNGKPPGPTPIINQVLQFKDGSRIKVIVEALVNPAWDQATDAYYNSTSLLFAAFVVTLR